MTAKVLIESYAVTGVWLAVAALAVNLGVGADAQAQEETSAPRASASEPDAGSEPPTVGADEESSDSPPAGAPKDSGAGKPAPAVADKPRGPMSFKDARENYPTVVENYILQKGRNGLLPFKDKNGRLWKLELEAVHTQPMRKLKKDVFTSCASMHAGSDALDVDFTVDFSGDRWRVTSLYVHKVNGKPRFKYQGAQRVPIR